MILWSYTMSFCNYTFSFYLQNTHGCSLTLAFFLWKILNLLISLIWQNTTIDNKAKEIKTNLCELMPCTQAIMKGHSGYCCRQFQTRFVNPSWTVPWQVEWVFSFQFKYSTNYNNFKSIVCFRIRQDILRRIRFIINI